MPVYEYQCRSCQQEFDEFVHSSKKRGAVVCPSCRSKKVDRKLSVFAARDHALDPKGGSGGGPCGRCGDPNGPCAM
ncbi:MAG: zinc ribbon domain-containing protein [Phycisphaerae bacterium]